MSSKKNSMWAKGKPRPQAWWLGVSKEPKKFKKQDSPVAKNAGYTKVYNVRVGGYSLGLTFDMHEARSWMKHASLTNDKFIETVAYSVPRI